MDEKQLLETLAIKIEDGEKTPLRVRELVVQQSLKIEELEQHLKELKVSRDHLNEKVNRNSENSHSPPSSDLTKPQHKNKKKKGGKKRGGQTGHQGHSRVLYPVEECRLLSFVSFV